MTSARLENKSFCLLFFFSIFLFATWYTLPTHAQTDYPDFISKICNHTIHYEVCNTSLRSVPESQTADVYNLTVIAINLTITEGMRIHSNISSMLVGRFLPSYGEKRLKDCVDLYSDAVDNLRLAGRDLALRLFLDVNLLVTAAMTQSSTCEDSFSEQKGHKSPLTEQNSYFFMLCSNILAINALLS